MSDIFREVEEDVRRERFVKLWKQYGDYAIAAGAVLLIGVAGFEAWQRYDTNQRAKTSATYLAAQDLTVPGAAASAFATVARTAPGGYRTLAQLQEASALLASGKTEQAVALYKSVAAANSGVLGALARLRAAWALADNVGKDDLQSLLAPLTDPSSPWSQMAHEVLAYADFRAGNLKAAGSEYQSLSVDPAAPDALRQRARAMVEFIGSGGVANYGTVPPPPPDATAPTAGTGAPAAGPVPAPAKGTPPAAATP